MTPGSPLAELDEDAIAANLAAEPWALDARAARLPGGSLLVSVRERVPVATAAAEGGERLAVDASGHVFSPVAGEGLLELQLAEPVVPGSQDPRLARAIALSQRLPDLGLAAPTSIDIAEASDPTGYTLRFEGLDTDFVLGREALEERLDRLSRLLAQRPGEVARAARVDLRFEDQVVLQEEATRKGSTRKAATRGRAQPRGTRRTG